MAEETTIPSALQPQELEAMYAISRVVSEAADINTALDQIIQLMRPVFIFDNMALYLFNPRDEMEPTYARIVGRGRSAEADLAWGEAIASDVIRDGKPVLHEEKLEGWQTNRLAERVFLGLPLRFGDTLVGVIVFGRFGGPAYTAEQIHLAEYVAVHIAQLFSRQQLVERVARLEAEKRLNALQSDFIALVSHELRTPLGFIKGYATTLLRDDINWDNETRREFLSVIDEEADRLRELIDSLLDSSRLQAGTLRMEFQPVRLDTLVRDIALRARSHHPNLPIGLELEPNVIVQADPTRLAQVFDNLLSNAVKYAPGAAVTISLYRSNDQVRISFKDYGPGIAAEHLAHLFERFYRVPTTQSSARGTGLGLFICRQIVHAHQGEITVESQLGQGTTFHVSLPLAATVTDKTGENT